MKALIAAAGMVAAIVFSSGAQAMPLTSPNVPEAVVKVDYACGWGWHLTRRGCAPDERRWHRPPPRWGWDRRPAHWDRDHSPRHWRGEDSHRRHYRY